MNLGLLDPFGQNYPEKIEAVLKPSAAAVTCAFNRFGTMLATGLVDGACVVWDVDTKGVSRELVGHVRAVLSVSWSRSGRRLLTASADKRCIVWDLLLQDGMPHPGARTEVQLDTAVAHALMHPLRNLVFVACAVQSVPVVVELVPRPDGSYDEKRTVVACVAAATDGDDGAAKAPASFIAAFDRKGDHLLLGDQRGTIYTVETKGLQLLSSFRISTGPIRTIRFSQARKHAFGHFLVNVADRSNHKIKVYPIAPFLEQTGGAPAALYEFQEVVNKYAWAQACFSNDGEFVVAGSASPGEHKIYIWDSTVGNLIKILEGEGPREGLQDLAWHPVRPIIASVGSFGNVFVWSIRYQENWSAYAPDFKELEENVEYEEREDEFDTVPEVDATHRVDAEQDVKVDVETVEGGAAYGGADLSDGEQAEEEPELLFLPILLDDAAGAPRGTPVPAPVVESNGAVTVPGAPPAAAEDAGGQTIEHDAAEAGAVKKRRLSE